MKQALTYLIAAAVLAALALLLRGGALFLLWPTVTCLLVGLAYAGLGAGVFGKRPGGSLPLVTRVLLLPYLGFTWAIWKLKRKISREPYFSEVVPGLWVGRRVLGEELPEGVQIVVDVTCEFAEPDSVLRRCEYRSLPTLNYAAPEPRAFGSLAAELAGREGIYIHCAQGHGRSATLAAAILLRRGVAASAAEALAAVVKVRPRVHLEASQAALLAAYAAGLPAPPPPA